MGSPVSLTFSSFIKIDRRKEDAVYLQIVYQFINAVRTQLLEEGDLLPGSRKLAEDLQVHRKTIVVALAELQRVALRPLGARRRRVAVELRHCDVHQNEVRLLHSGGRDALLPILRDQNLVSLEFEIMPYRGGKLSVVLDEQDAQRPP